MVEQLRICEKMDKSNKQEEEDNPTTIRAKCGFECAHCSKYKKKKYRWNRYPETVEDVKKDIMQFFSHLNRCKGVPSDLLHYFNWLEYGMDEEEKLVNLVDSITELVLVRLEAEEIKRNAELTKERRRKMMKKRTRQSHSVLENVTALDSVGMVR